jgi:hypothetical protein
MDFRIGMTVFVKRESVSSFARMWSGAFAFIAINIVAATSLPLICISSASKSPAIQCGPAVHQQEGHLHDTRRDPAKRRRNHPINEASFFAIFEALPAQIA